MSVELRQLAHFVAVAMDLLLHTLRHEHHAATSGARSDADRSCP